jgi:hypothetical protein
MKRLVLVVFLSAFAVSRAWCQNPNTPWLPVGLNGETGSLSTVGESEENQLSVGVSVGGNYYGTASSSNTGSQENVGSYTVAPNIAITEHRPRTSFTLQYAPGYTYSPQTGNELTQTSLDQLQYRITEKLTLQLGERYLRMNSWFTGLDVNPTVTTGNVIQQPNESILTTQTVETTSLSTLNLVYQASDSTVFGMGASFITGNFSNVQVTLNQPLFNSNSGTGSAYVQHRVHGNNWLGVTGTFQRIVTSGGVKEGADNPSLQVFYTFAPSAHTNLSLFAGPSYFSSQAETSILILGVPIPVTIPSKGWGAQGGAAVGWRGQLTGLSAVYMHRVSDGGGLTGAVRSDSASANFRRQLNQRWTANLALLYGNNNSESILFGGSFQRISGTVGLNWLLSDNFSAALSYARDHLSNSYDNLAGGATGPASVTSQTIGDNRAWVSISYHFTRPLGW